MPRVVRLNSKITMHSWLPTKVTILWQVSSHQGLELKANAKKVVYICCCNQLDRQAPQTESLTSKPCKTKSINLPALKILRYHTVWKTRRQPVTSCQRKRLTPLVLSNQRATMRASGRSFFKSNFRKLSDLLAYRVASHPKLQVTCPLR